MIYIPIARICNPLGFEFDIEKIPDIRKEIKIDELLKNSDIEYETLYDVDRISFFNKKEILSGKEKGSYRDVYIYPFTQIWGIEEKGLVLYIDDHLGEPLYIITPHGYIDIETK